MGRLFGTDGARGVANRELTPELAMNIGRAAAKVLISAEHRRPKILVGKDTRASGDMLETALAAGLCSVGADVVLLGVVPTPAVAFLVKAYDAQAGVMISASHNPCEYNGIKIFNGEGYKLPDALEEQIEAIVLDGAGEVPCPEGGDVGRVTVCDTAVADYVAHVASVAECPLTGMRIAVDCANGSASATARALFAALGADAIILNDQPDGVNINENCGSTHIEALGAFVKEHGLEGGVAFDGDADRCLAVDENGAVIDGDQIMAALALDMKEKGELAGNAVVGTVMSNLGFRRCCEQNGITPIAAKVGDRYVLEEMRAHGYALGGEQSGHIILLRHATTGDGQMSAVKLLTACRRKGMALSQMGGVMERYPQVLKNLRVTPEQKAAFTQSEPAKRAIDAADAALGEDGRVLVRLSGTEPLIRVMAEGKRLDEIDRLVNDLADEILGTL
ncbi:MAG: phosphoglucosamine mutase [Acutalibacteraceae bacterium]|jgi:phosphoglucosamine mutase